MFRMPWYIRGSCIGTGVRFRGISCEDVSFGCNLAVTQRRILFLLSCFLPPNAAGMEVLLADDDDDDGEEEEAVAGECRHASAWGDLQLGQIHRLLAAG